MNKSYDKNDVLVLEGLEAVRKRFDMYMGGLQTLSFQIAKEIIDNAVDEFQKGYGTDVWIELDTVNNRMTVSDNGRGLPQDMYSKDMSTMEVLFTKLHAGSNFDDSKGEYSAGRNGVGSKGSNALSQYFKVVSIRGKKIATLEMSRGKVIKPFTAGIKGKNYPYIKENGSVITFEPDPDILEEFVNFDVDMIKQNLKIRAYTNAGLKIHFKVDSDKEIVYDYENGIKDYLTDIVKNPFSKPYYFKEIDKATGNMYEVAMQYTSSTNNEILGYVNSIALTRGVHETGFKTGITRAMTKFMEDNKIFNKKITKNDISGEDIRSGLVVIINLKMGEFKVTSQTKDELTSKGVSGAINSYVYNHITEWSEENEKEFKSIGNRIIKFAQGRLSALKYKDKVSKVEGSFNMNFSRKFSPANSKTKPEDSELFIVEGDSAAGSCKNGRDPMFQAIYALKGKIKNSKDTKYSDILSNVELSELIKILYSTTDIKNINWEKCNFHKVIFTADADSDGKHINSLLINFFYDYLRPMFDLGFIYVSLPPKYIYKENANTIHYLKDDKDKNDFIYKTIKSSIKVKGLKNLVDIWSNYVNTFNIIKNKYSVSNDFMNSFIIKDSDIKTIDDLTERYKLEYNEEDDRVIGLHDGIWHDVYLEDFFNDVESIPTINKVSFKFNNKDMLLNPIDFYTFLDKNYKMTFNYLKGLGESDPGELGETILNPETRSILKIDLPKDENLVEEYLTNMFSDRNKPSQERKKMTLEYFSNK